MRIVNYMIIFLFILLVLGIAYDVGDNTDSAFTYLNYTENLTYPDVNMSVNTSTEDVFVASVNTFMISMMKISGYMVVGIRNVVNDAGFSEEAGESLIDAIKNIWIIYWLFIGVVVYMLIKVLVRPAFWIVLAIMEWKEIRKYKQQNRDIRKETPKGKSIEELEREARELESENGVEDGSRMYYSGLGNIDE